MSQTISTEPIPLLTDADGVIRVASTRVTLDSVVVAYHEGFSAEAITERYPAVPVAEVYSVLSYYLKHRDSVDAYTQGRRATTAEVRKENEARFNLIGIRDRLLSRR